MWRGDKQSGESQGLVPPCPRVSEAGGAAGDGWTDRWTDSFPLPQDRRCPPRELAWEHGSPVPASPGDGREMLLPAQALPFIGELRMPGIWSGLELSAEDVRSTVSYGSCLFFNFINVRFSFTVVVKPT